MCEKEEKSWNIQMKQIVVLKYWIKNVIKISLETLNQKK